MRVHLENNATTRDAWHDWAEHRARISALLKSKTRGGSLAVLGAGNCNDLALDELATHFTEIELIDLDGDALARGVARATANERIVTRVADFVAGLDALDARWAPTAVELTEWHDAANRTLAARFPQTFDVVLASCVISQLMWSIAQTLGASHPSLQSIAQLVLTRHLATCARLARRQVVLIIDVAAVPPGFTNLGELVEQNRCYPGTSPRSVLPLLRSVAPTLQFESGPVWTWPLRPDRHHLVYSVVATPTPLAHKV